MKLKMLLIKDDNIDNVRQDVLSFLSSSSYKRVLSISHDKSNLYRIVYESNSETVEKAGTNNVSQKV